MAREASVTAERDRVVPARHSGRPVRREEMASAAPNADFRDPDFRVLFESVPGLYLVLRPDLTIVAASDAYLEATMTQRERIIGHNLFQAFPDDPDDPSATRMRDLHASLQRVLASGAPDVMAMQTVAIRRSDGKFDERCWNPINIPVLGADQTIAYIIHRIEDVTEFTRLKQEGEEQQRAAAEMLARSARMEAEIAQRAEQLQEANDSLREANEQLATSQALDSQMQKLEAVGQLTGGIAHDFNNLLTVIIGNVDLLESEVVDREAGRRMMATIRRSAERGARLTKQLLAFSRQQTLKPETCNLNAVLIELDASLKRTLGDAVLVRTKLNPALWPCNIDIAQFDTAILNVAANAADAMPQGGTLTLTTRNVTVEPIDVAALGDIRPGRYVTVALADTGVGMSSDALSRAFDPFFTTKGVGKGSGLGLSQLYGFVMQSGGHVSLDSEIGRGTVVTLYLPHAHQLSEQLQAEPVEPMRIKGAETVLVVEDDADVLDVAVATLTDLGYRILLAYNGLEALQILERDEPIDLLFTDIVMPSGISGVQLAREARRLRQDIKVLLTSGYTTQTLAQEYGANTEYQIITKPYRQSELVEHVRRALGKRDLTVG
jgi:signal transduction histidine kinase/ActR/RegA family two-component response regulator